jgi:hypothetical protein
VPPGYRPRRDGGVEIPDHIDAARVASSSIAAAFGLQRPN